uniref:Methyltransferase FkbM domain-containing protein n=1 Tax=Plectus sambesii TaxID=2011161 RepID=A0A914VMJ1_9BILA
MPVTSTTISTRPSEPPPIFGDLKLITTITNPQHKIFVLNKHTELLSDIYLRHGSFEGHLQQLMKKALEKSQNREVTFFDIGANIGIHALYMAALNYNVVAVEADTDTFSMLSQSIAANGFFDRMQAINAAITSSRGNVEMLRNANNIGNTRIVSNEQAGTAPPGLRKTVRGIKLNDLVPFLPHNDIVLKIDIEGHECHVINAEQAQLLFTSKNITCISMEFTPKDMKADEACVAKMVDFFTQNKYVAYYVNGDRGKKVTSTNMYHEVNHDILWLPSSANAAEYF